ncbi:MAG TPA: deoxyribose-phosphate aldolase [Bacteroidetes bacterium]|nr:deoxyribose-phosphate aldolase [Bacteroidota bacterium]
MNKEQLARYIDHTLLKPNITFDQIDTLCKEASIYNFASVCIPPYFIKRAVENLQDYNSVGVCTVIDFPLGYDFTSAKLESIKKSIDFGVDEIDAVINIPAVKNADWKTVEYELESMRTITKIHDKILKIIFETCYLTKNEIEHLAKLCIKYDVDFLKTSTGFGTGGATVEDVKLMKSIAGDKAKVKASGGIRTREDALKMINAGAERIGASAGIKIVSE